MAMAMMMSRQRVKMFQGRSESESTRMRSNQSDQWTNLSPIFHCPPGLHRWSTYQRRLLNDDRKQWLNFNFKTYQFRIQIKVKSQGKHHLVTISNSIFAISSVKSLARIIQPNIEPYFSPQNSTMNLTDWQMNY